MKTVLMVAEKPSLAKTIADILSDHNAREVKIQSKTVYIWAGRFMNESVTFKMTSVFGHVYTLDFDHEFNKRIDPSLLFSANIIKKDSMPKLRVPQFLRGLAENEGKGLDYLVLWLDCDKEGENICFEILDNVKRCFNNKDIRINYNLFNGQASSNNSRNNYSRIVFRAKFSSLAPNEIKKAFNNLIDPNYLESRSVDARQELDLRIGCSFTRLQTTHLTRSLNQAEKIVVSFGPCQTPTLGFCVARDEFIKNFKSENFWTIDAQVSPHQARASLQKAVRLRWKRGRIFDRTVVSAYLDMIRQSSYGNKAMVKSVNTNIRQSSPPLALNTVQLLRIASSAFGFSPHFTMELAEKLYTSGYISYPRTETTVYSTGFDFNSIVASASSNYPFVHTFQNTHNVPNFKAILDDIVNRIYTTGTPFPLDGSNKRGGGGKDVGDHPPITPTPQIFSGGGHDRHLSGESKQLYDYIFTHFVATLMSNAKYLEHVTTFDLAGELFTSEHRELMDPGFMAVMPWKLGELGLIDAYNTSSAAIFREGQFYPLTKLDIHEGKTGPPSLLTESELIKLMEEHGIGTDASIPVHIKKIQDRNYVKIVNNPYSGIKSYNSKSAETDDFYDFWGDEESNTTNSTANAGYSNDGSAGNKKGASKGRYLMPTPLGIALVRGYEMIDLELVLPTMRAAMEKQLNLIAHGQADYQSMVQHALSIYQSKYNFFSRHIDLITATFMSIVTSAPGAKNYKITQRNAVDDNHRGRGRGGMHRTSSMGSLNSNSSMRGFRGRARGGRGRGGGGRGFKRGGGHRGRGGNSRGFKGSSDGDSFIAAPAIYTQPANPYYNYERMQRFL